MKKIGFVDYYLSEWHANNYPAWIRELESEYDVAYAWAELDVSPIDGVTTEQWCERFGAKSCKTIDELCQKCDAIVILAPSDPNKHLGYAKEVLKHGKTTYIDKTFAPDFLTAKEIFGMAKRYDTPFFSTSALRFADELKALKGAEKLIITGGGSNFEEYCIHTIEILVTLLKDTVSETNVLNQGSQKICSIKTENGKQATVIYAPKLGFTIAAEMADGTSSYTKISSDFFRNLMKDMIRFFEDKKVSFDTSETLEVMRVRDKLLGK